MTLHTISLLCGWLALYNAACIGLQEILLGPSSPNYPPGPWWVRGPLFLWMVTIAVRGVDILTSLDVPDPKLLSPSALAAWAAMALAQTAVLAFVIHERRSALYWQRGAKADKEARKGDRAAAAAAIMMDGVPTAFPLDRPEDTPDLLPVDHRRVLQVLDGGRKRC